MTSRSVATETDLDPPTAKSLDGYYDVKKVIGHQQLFVHGKKRNCVALDYEPTICDIRDTRNLDLSGVPAFIPRKLLRECKFSSDPDQEYTRKANCVYCCYCNAEFTGTWRKKNCIRHEKDVCRFPGSPHHVCIENTPDHRGCKKDGPNACVGAQEWRNTHPDLRAGRAMPPRNREATQ